MVTIRTDHYDPFLAQQMPILVPRRSKNGQKRLSEGSGAQNGWNKLEHFKHFKLAKMGCTLLYTFYKTPQF